MSIRNQENALFNKWKKKRPDMVRDGVVSEEDYFKSKPKIVFILKEPRSDGGGGDLRTDMGEGVHQGGVTWNNVARWVHGIRSRKSLPEWGNSPELIEVTQDFRKEKFKSICAMNLKKSPGGSSADHDVLRVEALEDKAYIQKQYTIYDPDITICGGTGDLFMEVTEYQKKWLQTRRGIRWYERDTGKYVIDYYHPAARCPPPIFMYGLLDAVEKICKW